MKKKILALISAAAIALTFTACTRSNDVQNALEGGNKTNNEVNNNSDNNSNNDDNNSDDKTKEEEKEPEKNDEGFKHGENTDSSYKSSFLNIEVEYGDDWTTYDDEYMASQNNIEDMSDENVNKVLDQSGVLYEMMAKLESNSNVNIVIENLNLTNGGKSLSAEEYLEAALPNLKTSLASTYEDAEVDMSTTTICGKELPCIKGSISSGEVSANEILVAVSSGKYIAIVTFTTLSDDDFNTLASAFKSIG